MKNIIFLSVLILLFSCKKSQEIKMIKSKGMDGKSEYIHFINKELGYSFNTLQHWEEATDDQLNDPKYLPQSTYEAVIYKTIDGGKNWKKIDSINDYYFYDIAFCDNEYIYIKIIDGRGVLNNRLLKFDLKTLKLNILDFNFERMGEIWSIDKKVSINSKNNGVNCIYFTDDNFIKIDSIKENNIFKSNVLILNKIPFVLTWNDELYNLENNILKKIEFIDPENLTIQDSNTLLIAGNKKTDDNSICLVSYNVETGKSDIIKEFEGYSIVRNLQSNDKVIVGFIGNIVGMFTKYDLFYSLDKGKTWHIQKLKEANHISPISLIDNVLYICSGGERLQKIEFKK